MNYGDVCTGISAASVAWHPLGWRAAFFSEIEPFPCKLLKYHYPDVPNLGDMSLLLENKTFINAIISLLVGGTPCQSFSLAGLRGGLADDRGNLALQYCRLLIAKRPRWFVWENVPGVLSSFTDDPESKIHFDGGDNLTQKSDFATLLTAFRECGYSCCWRIFDSQFFGVPQRRRRLFVIGYYGTDWRPPAAVLFEPQSGRRDIAPGDIKGQKIAGAIIDEAARRTWWDGGNISQTLDAVLYKGQMMPEKNRFPVVLHGDKVRKLTPLECERLQGFPDNYTAIPGAADGPRYKALGNSMTTHVMHWIGRRIQKVDKILKP